MKCSIKRFLLLSLVLSFLLLPLLFSIVVEYQNYEKIKIMRIRKKKMIK